MASNAQAATKGMAYQASARTFEWTNDLSEAATEAAAGMLISNHSYGTPVTNNGTSLPAWFIGAYSSEARDWDQLSYQAPYYLMVAYSRR